MTGETPSSAPQPSSAAAPVAPPEVAPSPAPEAAAAVEAATEKRDAAANIVQTQTGQQLEALRSSLADGPGLLRTLKETKEWVKSSDSDSIFTVEGQKPVVLRILSEMQAALDDQRGKVAQGAYEEALTLLTTQLSNLPDLGTVQTPKLRIAFQTEIDSLNRLKAAASLPANQPTANAPEAPVGAAAPTPEAPAPVVAPEAPSLTPDQMGRRDAAVRSSHESTSAIGSAFGDTMSFLTSKKEALLGFVPIRASRGSDIEKADQASTSKLTGFQADLTALDSALYTSGPTDFTRALTSLADLQARVDSFFGESVKKSGEAIEAFRNAGFFAPKDAEPILVAISERFSADQIYYQQLFKAKKNALLASQKVEQEISEELRKSGVSNPEVVLAASGSDLSAELETAAEKAKADAKQAADSLAALPAPTDADKATEALAEVYAKREELAKAFSDGHYLQALVVALAMMMQVIGNIGPLMDDSGGFMKLVDRLFKGDEAEKPPASFSEVLAPFALTEEADLTAFQAMPMEALLLAHQDKLNQITDDAVRQKLMAFKVRNETTYKSFLKEVMTTNGGQAFAEADSTAAVPDPSAPGGEAPTDTAPAPVDRTLGGFIQSKLKSWKRTES